MKERLFERGMVTAKICRHGLMLYMPTDIFIGGSLEHYGEWCESEITLLAPYVPSGGLVLDAGANIGTHALAFAEMVGPAGHVLAFEPQRVIFALCAANAVINKHFHLRVFNLAVGERSGKVIVPSRNYTMAANFGGLSVETVRENSQTVGEVVDCISIDALKLKRCNLIKADVEGMEAEVVLGARETIERCRPVLFLENDRSERSARLMRVLKDLNYVAYWHISQYFNPENFFGYNKNLFAGINPQANILCFHKEDERSKQVSLPPVEGEDDTWEKAWIRLQDKR